MTHTLFFVIICSTAVVSWNSVGISRPTGTVCADLNRLEHNYVGGRLCLMMGVNAPLEPILSSLPVWVGIFGVDSFDKLPHKSFILSSLLVI